MFRNLWVAISLVALLSCNKAQILAPSLDFSSQVAPVAVEHGFVTVPQGAVQFFNDNDVWQYRGVTSFTLFQRYLDGENISSLLDVYRDSGGNTVRVLGMYAWERYGYKDFYPASYGDRYFFGLAAFTDEVAAHQMRVEFVVFADAQIVIPETSAQQRHAQAVYSVLQGRWNAFIELANEAEINGVDPRQFQRPNLNGVLASAGSQGGGNVNGTTWDYGTVHTDRNGEWYTTINFIPRMGVPVVLDEPMGAANFSVLGRRDNDPDHFYQFGKKLRELNIAGATFHSEGGLHSLYPNAVEIACMKQMFRGMTGK